MGKLSSYAMLLFGVSIVLYLMGFTSPFLQVIGQIGTETPILDLMFDSIYSALTNPIFLLGLAAAGIASVAGNWGYGTTSFLAPLMLFTSLGFFANYFILPTSFIFQAGFPMEIKLLVNAFLNVFLMLAMMEFIRGGDI